ncbi:MAG: hypothetical protein E7213_07365 [Clostridium sp.]|nr:hypothetical protein [Clostridium sp.]
MGKTIFINMNDVKIKGDILDLSSENSGIVYSISKDVEEELCVDYVNSDDRDVLSERKYDACTFVFNLNKIFGSIRKAKVIKEVINYLKDNGEIYIWDVNKERGKIIDYKINVALPGGDMKTLILKNYNLISSCKYEEIKKMLQKYVQIEETKVWEDIFFIKAVKKKSVEKEEAKEESIIDSYNLEIYS